MKNIVANLKHKGEGQCQRPTPYGYNNGTDPKKRGLSHYSTKLLLECAVKITNSMVKTCGTRSNLTEPVLIVDLNVVNSKV